MTFDEEEYIILWNAPTLAELYKEVVEDGIDPSTIRLTGWEPGGLQVFKDE